MRRSIQIVFLHFANGEKEAVVSSNKLFPEQDGLNSGVKCDFPWKCVCFGGLVSVVSLGIVLFHDFLFLQGPSGSAG